MKHLTLFAALCLLGACNLFTDSKSAPKKQTNQQQSTLRLSDPVISVKSKNANQWMQVYRYTVTAACLPNVSVNNVYPLTQPEGMVPKAAWVGDFSGGDFAEVTWTIQELNAKSYRLWAVLFPGIRHETGGPAESGWQGKAPVAGSR